MSRTGSVVMRLILVPFCVFAIVFSFTARADEVKFKSSGKVSGTIAEVAFRIDGKIVKYARGDISMFYFSPTGQDSLTLTSGKKVTGAIVSVILKTARGKMTFKGLDLQDVVLKSDPVAEARRSILAARRAKIAADDAKGVLELAKWAREEGLAPEAEALARSAMQVDFKSDVAVEAHKFLGHVLYDGEWMTKAEMAKRKRIHEGRLPSAKEIATETAKSAASEEEADNARLAAAEDMASPSEQNARAGKVFLDKVERIRRRHLKSVYSAYDVARKRLNAQIKQEQRAIKKSRAEHGAGKYISVHVRDASGGIATSKSDKAIAQANKSIMKLKAQRVRLDMAKRRRVAGITKKLSDRKKRVLATKARISKKLAAGEEISLTQMIASYKKALE